MTKIAVVLFNLGGPDSPAAVQPFLFNLFNDPAIVDVPGPVRRIIAAFVSWRRAPLSREIYAHLGGRSPLLEWTEAQARALEQEFTDFGEARVFIAMRYWRPLSEQAARAVAAYGPDEVILLPLYPQFSTTTTGSSLGAWRRAAQEVGLSAPTRAVCCYPTEPALIAAHARLIADALDEAGRSARARLLFSAHGLPKRVIDRGDPYRWQVERTAEAVAARLGRAELDWLVCYQSRVGPLQWIGPSTRDEIVRAGREGVALVVAPIAFVSEHAETLVELDIEYRKLAVDEGVPAYLRTPALGTEAGFITGLADLVRRARARPGLSSQEGRRICPDACVACPQGSGQAF